MLATSLGITEAKLQAALEASHPAKGDRDDKRTRGPPPSRRRSASLPPDVQAVLGANRPDPPAAGSAPQQRPTKPDEPALANELGLDATKVGSPLEA